MVSKLAKTIIICSLVAVAVAIAVAVTTVVRKDNNKQKNSDDGNSPPTPMIVGSSWGDFNIRQEWKDQAWFSDTSSIPPNNATTTNLLLVGNSYVLFNNLTHMVQEILWSGDDDDRDDENHSAQVRSYSPGGDGFEHHVYNIEHHDNLTEYVPTALDLAMGHDDPSKLRRWLVTDPPLPWSWVILQEKSAYSGYCCSGGATTDIVVDADHDEKQRQEIWNTSLFSSQELDGYIQDNNPGAQTMFYQTWGRRDSHNTDDDDPDFLYYPDFLTMQHKVTQGYNLYKEATSTPDRPTWIAPVGEVFRTIYLDIQERGLDPLDEENSIFYNLYRDDGSHPSLWGSYVAALTIYVSIVGDDPRKVNWYPNKGKQGGTSDKKKDTDTAMYIQHAVAKTILDTALNGEIVYPWQ